MSTDKLEVLHNTVAEILREPASPPTYFDEEPDDAAQAGERVAKAPDNLRRVTETPMEHFGKAPPREAHVVRDARNEIPGIARQSLADQFPASPQADPANQLASRLSHEVPGPRADPQTRSINAIRPAVSDNRVSPGGWALRGIAGILVAGGIGAGLATWLKSSGDAAKTAASQPAPLVQTAPAVAALPPELTPLLQSMSRDLASMGKEIEQLKADRELMARDNAKLNEQVRASHEQLTRAVAQLSEQLKASQEQAVRDNASVAVQIKGIQEQLTGVISRASEQSAPPRIAATPPRPTPPSPRPAAPAVRQPASTLSSPQANAQPRAERPRLSATPRPPAPALAR